MIRPQARSRFVQCGRRWFDPRGPIEPAYLVQFEHTAVTFGNPADRASFILAPEVGQSRAAAKRRLTFSTTTGFVRAWLKLMRGSKLFSLHSRSRLRAQSSRLV